MSETDALQGRIMAALDRIGQGLEKMQAAPAEDAPETGETEQLRRDLEEERLANAQLEERVKALSAKLRKLEEEGAASSGAREKSETERRDAMRRMDTELQALRLANQQLRDNNAALREANETGVVEPHLINKAMMAELEGLRAARAADRAEMDLVLAELDRTLDTGGETGDAETEDA